MHDDYAMCFAHNGGVMKELQNAAEHAQRATAGLSLIPTVDIVVFPQMVVPLLVMDQRIIDGINKAVEGSKEILLVAVREGAQDPQKPIAPEDLCSVGTLGKIMRVMNMAEGGMKVLAQGLQRVKINNITATETSLVADIEEFPFDTQKGNPVLERKIREIVNVCERMSSLGGSFNQDFHVIFSQIDDLERSVDFLLSHLTLSVAQSQALLEKGSMIELLDELYLYLETEAESARMQEKIKHSARDAINKSQREYYLREQLRAIQKELGDDGDAEFDELKKQLENPALSEEARNEAKRQLRRLERTSPDSLEATVIRNHLEWLLSLPWGVTTKDNLNITHAKETLDRDHYGLEKIKDRILDYLSVKNFQKNDTSAILCFSGAPGVGKTSLGKSIAECLGRKFFRIAVGGVHDESEFRGHRRTYVGALPGRIIQAMHKTGSMNPVIVIDEIDKIGSSGKGDPSAALLEILDPEQNNAFYDNYLGVHFDLSKVMFLATSNDLHNIPGPLRDRMEIIELSGYTTEEKIKIAKHHLAPKAIELSGLAEKGIELSDEILKELITSYTRESGVRTLSRYIQTLCSKFARALLEKDTSVTFTKENLAEFLGPRKITFDRNITRHRIGVTNGLAWTPYGGEILQVEAVLMPGAGRLTLTGQLGDVMKESAQAAVSFIRSRAESLGIDKKMFAETDLHIHLPAGAIPKDGPSAGITLISSILSVMTSRPINGSFAMTGEVDLHGTVLPIGGLKEKILAAKQHGVTNVIVPIDNKPDLDGMDKLFENIQLHFVSHVDEVVAHVLMEKIQPA